MEKLRSFLKLIAEPSHNKADECMNISGSLFSSTIPVKIKRIFFTNSRVYFCFSKELGQIVSGWISSAKIEDYLDIIDESILIDKKEISEFLVLLDEILNYLHDNESRLLVFVGNYNKEDLSCSEIINIGMNNLNLYVSCLQLDGSTFEYEIPLDKISPDIMNSLNSMS